jgi:hypothetical protein
MNVASANGTKRAEVRMLRDGEPGIDPPIEERCIEMDARDLEQPFG